MSERKRGFATRSVQGTKLAKPGPAVEPIVQASTFIFENQQEMFDAVQGKSGKDVYTRWSNPTTRNAEEKISSLENTEETVLLSSGMAAISSVVYGFLKQGDKMLACDSIYGGTLHLFKDLLPLQGIEVEFHDLVDFPVVVEESSDSYDMIYFETPTNPVLGIIDIKRVADAAKDSSTLSVIDNTFASPINQRPHELGVDVVIHSATKYLGGHSDLIAGSVSGTSENIDKVRSAAKLLGGTIDPFVSFLIDRGMKTLAARIKWHNANAEYLAKELSNDSRISRIHYPGLQSHPNHDVAKQQMSGYGGMIAIDLAADLDVTRKFVDSLELFLNAVSLGGVESLASIPALTTHYGFSSEELAETNICESTVRLSVGIEDPEDLVHDILQALDNSVK